MDLTRFGIWHGGGGPLPPYLAPAVEAAGFHRLWLAGPRASLANIEEALAATTALHFASGIVNIWSEDGREVAASFHRLEERFPGRFLLGIGAGHREMTSDYTRPYEAINRYLDVLDAEGVPTERRVLAALGPRLLRLARDRSAGAHPYLVPPKHTAIAREILGTGKVLAPEHKVVLNTDPEAARAVGRPHADMSLRLANYTSNLRRLGFTDDDLADARSDRLVDALVARGTADEIAARLGEHLAAGADEVAVQVLTADPSGDISAELTELGAALSRWDAAH